MSFTNSGKSERHNPSSKWSFYDFIDSLGLSLTGMRIGPRDKKSAVAKVGASPSYVKAEESSFQYKPQIMKVRFLNNLNYLNTGKVRLLRWFQDPR